MTEQINMRNTNLLLLFILLLLVVVPVSLLAKKFASEEATESAAVVVLTEAGVVVVGSELKKSMESSKLWLVLMLLTGEVGALFVPTALGDDGDDDVGELE